MRRSRIKVLRERVWRRRHNPLGVQAVVWLSHVLRDKSDNECQSETAAHPRAGDTIELSSSANLMSFAVAKRIRDGSGRDTQFLTTFVKTNLR